MKFLLILPIGAEAEERTMKSVLRQVFAVVIFVALLLGIAVPLLITKGDEMLIIEAEPGRGFHWPYYLYIPGSTLSAARDNKDIYLLIEPNNTGYSTDDQSVHEVAAKKLAQRRSAFARGLQVPLLVPAFPRPQKYHEEIYTHALDRGAITIDIPELKRLDFQLVSMIKDAQEELLSRGINTKDKVLMTGFSASGMFVNRFTILHPDLVQAAAIGAPGGWPTVPVGEFRGMALEYPLGVHDLEELVGKEFDLEAFKAVPLYLYVGEEDPKTNDCVPPVEYMREDQRFIYVDIGARPIERWPVAEEIYRSVGCSSRFVSYPGVGHSITSEMLRDVKTFFLEHLDSH